LLDIKEVGINKTLLASTETRSALFKPGFTRFNLPFFYDQEQVDFVLDAVAWVAEHGYKLMPIYNCEPATGTYTYYGATKKMNEGIETENVYNFIDPSSYSAHSASPSSDHLSRGAVKEARCEYFQMANRNVAEVVSMASQPDEDAFNNSPEFVGDQDSIDALNKLERSLVWFMRRSDVTEMISMSEKQHKTLQVNFFLFVIILILIPSISS
jgi:hypothetical protein